MTVSSVEAVQVRVTESWLAEAWRLVGRSGQSSPVASLVSVTFWSSAWIVYTAKIRSSARAQPPRAASRDRRIDVCNEGTKWDLRLDMYHLMGCHPEPERLRPLLVGGAAARRVRSKRKCPVRADAGGVGGNSGG